MVACGNPSVREIAALSTPSNDPRAQRKGWMALVGLFLLSSLPALQVLSTPWMAAEGGGAPGELWGRTTTLFVHLLLSLLLAAAVGRLRWCLWLLAPSALLGPAEAFYLHHFGLPSGAHVYGVIAETDFAEASAWIGAGWLAVMACGLCLLAAVTWAAREVWRANLHWRHRSRYWVLAGGVLLLAVQAAVLQQAADFDARMEKDDPGAASYVRFELSPRGEGVLGLLESLYPWGLPQRFHRYLQHRHAMAEHLTQASKHDFAVRAVPDAHASNRQVHVLVIGETGRLDRWGLFGSTRNTTPRLARREGLLAFSDVVGAASATREAVPLMLTRRPPESMLAPTSEPSVVTAFKQAGFRTYWLSSQGSAGSHETPVSVLANEADERRYINGADYRGSGAFDAELLPLLEKVLSRPERKQFIVVHTLGSHLHYAHRYPAEFARFQPSYGPEETPDIWQPAQLEKLRNAYDNSVLYTDLFLDRAIAALDTQRVEATLLYAADHGETLFDGHCGRAGHGFSAVANYRIPMVMWASTSWRAVAAQRWARLSARQTQPFSAMAVFPTLTGLAGFETSAPHAHQDMGAERRQTAPRRVTHFGDFDRDVSSRGCDVGSSRL